MNENYKSDAYHEIINLDAVGQAELIRNGDVQPIELVDASINQIQRLNPHLNAVITPLFEKARTYAQSGLFCNRPFGGVPFLLKDFFCETKDDPYFAGMRFLRDLQWRSQHDTHLATRFREAGFVFLGKTNLPELAGGVITEPDAFGPTRNPWNPLYTPAGSSGGSAAAVASRMVAVAHANDGLGSIRIPAGCCGLVGLKPSRGRISPGPNRSAGLLENIVEFVVTRSVRDSAAILDAVAGSMPGDRFTLTLPDVPYSEQIKQPCKPLKVGLMIEHPFFDIPIHQDIIEAVELTGRLLSSIGHHVEYAYPTQFHGTTGLGLALRIIGTSGTASMLDFWSEKTGKKITESDVESATWRSAELGRTFTASDVHLAHRTLALGASGTLRWWHNEAYDLLVTPLMAQPKVAIGENKFETIRDAFGLFAMEFSITGQPALSVPMLWTEDKMPIGVQLVSDIGREDLLLNVAARLELINPWLQNWPTPIEKSA